MEEQSRVSTGLSLLSPLPQSHQDGALLAVRLVEGKQLFEGKDADDVAVEHKEGLAVAENLLRQLQRPG